MILGKIIKKQRLQKKYTLKELGEITGYTPSFLSQIERNIKTPSLQALKTISEALGGLTVTSLLSYHQFPAQKDEKERPCSVIKGNQRQLIEIPDSQSNFYGITPSQFIGGAKPQLHGSVVVIPPRALSTMAPVSHYAEECEFVLKGPVEVHVNDEVHALNTGDSIYLKSNVEHSVYNPGNEPAQMLFFTIAILTS